MWFDRGQSTCQIAANVAQHLLEHHGVVEHKVGMHYVYMYTSIHIRPLLCLLGAILSQSWSHSGGHLGAILVVQALLSFLNHYTGSVSEKANIKSVLVDSSPRPS